jgi:aryl-alcohol dehydrogenase-like predicted oxidoreductase
MPVDNIKEKLSDVVPVRQQLDKLADNAGMDMVEMSMRYVISNNDITSVLVGVDSVEQMNSNLELFAKGPLPHDVLKEIDSSVPDFPEVIVRPCLWND